MQTKKKWFLRKKDGSEYGPVSVGDLQRWSAQCRLVAGNAVSEDREEWTPVEDIPELEMHWMATRADGKEYGPFALCAVQELFSHNVLPAEAILVNRKTGENKPLNEVIELPDDVETDKAEATEAEAASEDAAPEANQETEATQTPDTKEATPDAPPETQEASQTEASAVPESDGSDRSDGSDGSAETVAAKSVAEKNADAGDSDDETAADAPAPSDEAGNKGSADSEHIAAITAPLLDQIESLEEELKTVRSEAELTGKNHKKALSSLEKQLESAENQTHEALAKLEALSEERQQIKQQVGEELAELRKQTAFMKKNIAVLHSELDEARHQSATRGRVVMVMGTLFTIIAALLIIRTVGGCQRSGEKTGFDHAIDNTAAIHTDDTPSYDDIDHDATAILPWPTIQVDGVRVERKTDHLRITFDEGAFARMTTLSDKAIEQLKSIVKQLAPNQAGYRLVVEGHTDNIPMRATSAFADNAALAAARGETGAAFLKEAGVQAIAATNPGPAPYPNDTADGRRRNRTLVIKLYR
jgi:flagellar motor protein MotB